MHLQTIRKMYNQILLTNKPSSGLIRQIIIVIQRTKPYSPEVDKHETNVRNLMT